jgi:membrane associated rhomboid family serine protease
MVFPIGDDNRDRRSFPVVTVTLIAMNVFVFVVFQGMGANEAFTMAYSTVPAEITSGKDLVTEDKVVQATTTEGRRVEVLQPGLKRTPIPVYLTLLTAVFMHGGIAHLLGNMWFLWIFGDNIEDDMGRVRYTIFYLLCGLLASLAHVMTNWTSQVPSLGASGAISGVMGAYLLLHPHRQVRVVLLRVLTDVPGWVAVGIWFAFQVVNGLFLMGSEGGGVAYGAHIGGFVAGMALAKPFMLGRPARKVGPDRRSPSYGQF